MNQLIASASTGVMTMSTREIADLLERQHSHIKISAERLAFKGVIGTLAVREFTHNGNDYTEYLLNKRDSLILVAQNSPQFTARIVDRWQELEAKAEKPAFQLPSTFSEALRLAAEQAEQIERQQAQLAIAEPKAKALDRIAQADGEKCITDAAKAMQMQPRTLFAWLEKNGWIFRRGSAWVAYQSRIQSGYLCHRITVVERKDGTPKEVAQVMVTPKGQTKLAKVAA